MRTRFFGRIKFVAEEGDFPAGRRWRDYPPEWLQLLAEVEFMREPAPFSFFQGEFFAINDGDCLVTMIMAG